MIGQHRPNLPHAVQPRRLLCRAPTNVRASLRMPETGPLRYAARTGAHCLTGHTGTVKREAAGGASALELSEGSDHKRDRQ
jgi:hypothetical protein